MEQVKEMRGDHYKIMDWTEEVDSHEFVWLLDDQLNTGWEFVTILQKASSRPLQSQTGRTTSHVLIPTKLLFRKVKS